MNKKLAAQTIGVMALILQETKVPHDRLLAALAWALVNVKPKKTSAQ